MGKKSGKIPGLDPVREFPYYKLQTRNHRLGVWEDIQKKFQSLSDLCQFAGANLSPEVVSRVMIVEDYKSRRVLGRLDELGDSAEY